MTGFKPKAKFKMVAPALYTTTGAWPYAGAKDASFPGPRIANCRIRLHPIPRRTLGFNSDSSMRM
jgi:hypothetical protein